jgi:isopenicillin N synthase-like dioxygenase
MVTTRVCRSLEDGRDLAQPHRSDVDVDRSNGPNGRHAGRLRRVAAHPTRPPVHLSQEHQEMSTETITPSIPLIDVRSAVDRAPSPALVDQVADACSTSGFFAVTNHGVDAGLIESMHEVTHEFFQLEPERKERYSSPTGNRYRGYSSVPTYSLSDTPDLAEVFEVTSFDGPEDLRAAGYPEDLVSSIDPNIWPDEPSGFVTTWRAYFHAVEALASAVLEAASLALGLPQGWFAPHFDRQSSYLTGLYYPAQDTDPLDGQLRRSLHTDVGALTILYQPTGTTGLEVQLRDGSYLPVTGDGETFVVNLGDMIAQWTNDRWVATPHRVVNPPAQHRGADRLTIGFFQNPNHDALIECIPTCLEPGQSPRHRPVLARDWTDHRMQLEAL